MPTVLSIGSFRFHFYSNEGNEPAHIHIESPDGECKFWLDPIILAYNKGIPTHKVRKIEQLTYENKALFIEKYYEYHNRK